MLERKERFCLTEVVVRERKRFSVGLCVAGWKVQVKVGACCAVLGFVLMGSAFAQAMVIYSKEEALEIAFPLAEEVIAKSFFLTPGELAQVAEKARVKMDSKLVTFYVGYAEGIAQGYAFIETHIVRTFPETFLVVISPGGTVEKLVVLAFYEPPEYLPSDRWLKQFSDKRLSAEMRLRRGIHGIMGSTLTAQAATSGVRKVLALFELLIEEQH